MLVRHSESLGATVRERWKVNDGYYYLGSLYSDRRSLDAHTWTQIQGAPNGVDMTGDGQRIFSVDINNVFYTAPETDRTTWTALTSPVTALGRRVPSLVADANHNVLYVPATNAGLWRYITH